MNVIAPNRQIIEETSNFVKRKKTTEQKKRRNERIEKLRGAGTKFRDAGGVTLLENLLLGNPNAGMGTGNQNQGGYTPSQAEIDAEIQKNKELQDKQRRAKTTRNILIGVAVAGVLGFVIYKMTRKKGKAKGKPTTSSVK